MKDAEQIASAVAYVMEKCCECPLTEICNENCENMWKRFLTSGRVRGNPYCTHCENRKGTWIDTITSLLGTKAVVVLEDGKVETYPLDRLKVITKRER